MLRDLVFAIGIPLVLLLLAVLAMEQWRDQLPAWLQRLDGRASVLALEHRHRADHWPVAAALVVAALRLDLARFKE